MICNTAIFYDIENLTGLFGGKTNTVLHLDEIYRRVLEMEGVHGVSVQRAYADWSIPNNKNFRNSVLQVGIEPVHIFNTNQQDKVKNAADVSLIIDVVDSISKRPEIENYVIASGDGIFALVAKKLHENGKRIIGCSFAAITNSIFLNACDNFILLEKTDASIIATSSRRKTAPKATTNSFVEPEEPPTPTAFPKTKYTDVLLRTNIPIWHDIGDSAGCFHTVRRIIETLFCEETQSMPPLEISVFTNYMNHYIPNFKVTKHGFKRVGEFIRFILTGSPYCLFTAANNVLRIAPREIAAGTNIFEDVKGLLITSANGNKFKSVFDVPQGEPFIYSIMPQPALPAPPPIKKKKIKSPEPQKIIKPEPQKETEIEKEIPKEIKIDGSIRKWIKDKFEELSAADALPPGEVRKLTTPEYAQTVFGVRSPIFKEIETRSNLNEQRTANGKIKYWKESFRFNGKMFIVYKEWVVNLHEERFIAWLETLQK
ncbi:MAG: NYN domain-containing protein [Defluviitaleaceae bacterium]|nr:NYN domain-containing protein [Defluviitaleaceae bacterium]